MRVRACPVQSFAWSKWTADQNCLGDTWQRFVSPSRWKFWTKRCATAPAEAAIAPPQQHDEAPRESLAVLSHDRCGCGCVRGDLREGAPTCWGRAWFGVYLCPPTARHSATGPLEAWRTHSQYASIPSFHCPLLCKAVPSNK
jgi:hypothetical protein